jgi:hypothetical protein
MVQPSTGRLLLFGGKTQIFGGDVDFIFEFNEFFGFKLLEERMSERRHGAVAVVIGGGGGGGGAGSGIKKPDYRKALFAAQHFFQLL